MENQELIAKYKRQLDNPNINEEIKSSIRKKLAALEGEGEKSDGKESSKEGDKSARIEELKEILKSDAPEIAKKRWQKELDELLGEQKPKAKAKPKPKVEQKPKPKPKVEEKPKPKPKVKRKVVRGKPEKPKVTPKPKVEAKPKTKVVKKVEKTKPIPKRAPKKVVLKKKPKPQKVYEPKVKTLAGEPDCDTLLKQFRARRRKSKEAQKKRKTTPIFRKISVDVVDAVEKAIKNVPAQQIKESPKETIRKFGVLKKLAQDFLNAFKDVLGKEFNKSEAKKELDELTILIDKLNKKYTSKK